MFLKPSQNLAKVKGHGSSFTGTVSSIWSCDPKDACDGTIRGIFLSHFMTPKKTW